MGAGNSVLVGEMAGNIVHYSGIRL